MQDNMRTDLSIEALNRALKSRKPPKGVLHPSDRGAQYASHAFQDKLKAYGVICSMSRKGECYDNAVIKSFFHNLKTELVYLKNFQTRSEGKDSISEYIEFFYNHQRFHLTLGYLSPHEFEKTKKVA